MSQPQLRLGARRPHGLSLVELLVAMTIGLALTLAATSAFVSASSAGRMADAQMRMNEDAQAALAILQQQLRMAGSNPVQPDRVVGTRRNPVYAPPSPATASGWTRFALRGCEATFSNIRTAALPDDLVCPPADATAAPHSIAVTYEADAFNTVPTGAKKKLPTDCLGNALDPQTAAFTVMTAKGAVSDTVTYYVADNRFFIATSPAVGVPGLYCKGQGGSAQPLVDNIEDLRFTYGTLAQPASAASASVAGYVRAAPTSAAASRADEAESWNKVVSVRICVVARSELPVVHDQASARYHGCDGNLKESAPDRRLRRAYSTTVVLRNRASTSLPAAPLS
jgi:type IV pilus assembly protein PilW